MKRRTVISVIAGIFVIAVGAIIITNSLKSTLPEDALKLTVAIAPYQDLAMLETASKVGIDAKHGLSLSLVTMAWEDILPAVASAGATVDVGFGSYVEYLTKYYKLNDGSSDPIVYVQPLYVYKGGGFIALSSDIAPFNVADLANQSAMQRLKGYKIGAQKQSLYDMMLYSVARRASIDRKDLRVFDTPMNDGLLALETKSLDLAAAGLPQVTEAGKRGGRLVLSMEDAGFADVTGFICRKSTLEKKRKLIEALILTWFDSVDYVYSDMKSNSVYSLDYLRKQAATKYTYEEYAQALSQEFLPRSIGELQSNMLRPGSRFDFTRIGTQINSYLIDNGLLPKASPLPVPLLGQP